MTVADYMVADTRYVTAAQDRDFYAGVVGKNRVVLDVGSKLAYTLVSATELQVADGVLVSGGGRLQIDAGQYESFSIPTGTAGVTAYYIIGYTVYSDGTDCEKFVQSVASATSTITETDMREGASSSKISLYRITQEGTTISNITALFTELSNLQTITANMYPVGAVFKTSQNTNPATFIGGTWSRVATWETLSVSGSKVASASGGSLAMHTLTEIKALFNAKYGYTPTLIATDSDNSTYTDLGVIYLNGQWEARNSIVYGAIHNTQNQDRYYARVSEDGSQRIDFTYITHREVYEWRRTA